ncbi:MAG: type II secretion system ATPase GspE [Proteobacteria bacterium]|nr:type II secretion system ATPase GspE [Pseudomonadota bacterium]
MGISSNKIGQILLEHTSLTPEQLEEVLEIQRQKGLRLGEILISKNYLTPEELAKALAIQMGYPYLDQIPFAEVAPNLIKDIPINYAKQHLVLPISRTDDYIVVVVADPLNPNPIDDLRLIFKKEIKVMVSSPINLQESINRVYERSSTDLIEGLEESSGDDLSYDLNEPVDLLDAGDDEAPIIRLVNSLMFRAVKEKASDIHVEPYEKEVVVRFRIYGILYDVFKTAKKFHASIASRIKVMGDLDIAEKRLPQDGRIKIKIAGKDVDIRLSSVPTSFGERLVMRILDKTSILMELPELGFSGKVLDNINTLINKKHGIFLVTGPTGSGKSTTLYACLTKIRSVERNIITVEDPVEYQLQGVGQIQVNPKIDLTFATGLRAILRQDPDIIMVGEIRDTETAEMAIDAALTGHVVLSTLHTNDAPGAITRLVDMGIEPFLVSSSILGVVGQRLVRKLCTYCREPYVPNDVEIAELGISKSMLSKYTLYRAVGCEKCSNTGYTGRTVISELMVVTDPIRALILSGADAGMIKKQALQEGMTTVRQNAITKVLQGITSIEELYRATQTE